jgi:hypothetical protein
MFQLSTKVPAGEEIANSYQLNPLNRAESPVDMGGAKKIYVWDDDFEAPYSQGAVYGLPKKI